MTLAKEKPDLSAYKDEIREAERESKLPERAALGPGRKNERAEAAAHSSGTASRKGIVREKREQKPIEEKVFGHELKNTPTTLEQAMTMEKESQTSNEILGVLVDAHIKEADAILGRTFLRREDFAAVTDCLHLARTGIGGVFKKPMPWLSQWVVDKLRALPSIDGKSREQFVESWQNSANERRRQDEQKNREKAAGFA